MTELIRVNKKKIELINLLMHEYLNSWRPNMEMTGRDWLAMDIAHQGTKLFDELLEEADGRD